MVRRPPESTRTDPLCPDTTFCRALGVWGLIWISRGGVEPVARLLPAAVRVGWWVSLPMALVIAWLAGLVVLGPLDAEFTPAHLAYRDRKSTRLNSSH